MRLSTAPFLATLLAAAAECASLAFSAIPFYTQPCFANGVLTISCGGLDLTCQYQQQAVLHTAIETRVASACEVSTFQDVIDGAETGAQQHNTQL